MSHRPGRGIITGTTSKKDTNWQGKYFFFKISPVLVVASVDEFNRNPVRFSDSVG